MLCNIDFSLFLNILGAISIKVFDFNFSYCMLLVVFVSNYVLRQFLWGWSVNGGGASIGVERS